MSSAAHPGELGELLTEGQDPVLSAGGDAPAPLVVLLHGHGGTEHDMAVFLPQLPPGWAVVSIRAPLRHGNGFTWFRGARDAPEAQSRDVSPVADVLLQRIRGAATGRPVAVAGFSQGGAVAVQMMRRQPDLIRAGVTLAGFVAAGPEPGDDRLRAVRPPVFWGRGSDDDVITRQDIHGMEAFLPVHTSLTAAVYPGLAHWMSADQLRDASEFLARSLRPGE